MVVLHGGGQELLEAGRKRRTFGGEGEATGGEPEGGAEGIEGGDFLLGQGFAEAVPHGATQAEAGATQLHTTTLAAHAVAPALAAHRLAGAHESGHTPGIGGGPQIHEALAVDAAVRMDAGFLGGAEQTAHQFGVGELIAEELLHHRQPTAHHGGGHRRGGQGAPALAAGGSNVNVLAWSGNAPLGSAAAAVGEVGNGAVLLGGDDGNGVAP